MSTPVVGCHFGRPLREQTSRPSPLSALITPSMWRSGRLNKLLLAGAIWLTDRAITDEGKTTASRGSPSTWTLLSGFVLSVRHLRGRTLLRLNRPPAPSRVLRTADTRRPRWCQRGLVPNEHEAPGPYRAKAASPLLPDADSGVPEHLRMTRFWTLTGASEGTRASGCLGDA